jgi:SAM-dependent methyltransferase
MQWLFRLIPGPVRRRVRSYLLARLDPTISQAWEGYARNYRVLPGRHLGDEWNDPVQRGMEAKEGEFLKRLDEQVFAPFLGMPEVILEIGAGGGRFTEILLPKCRKIIASDVAPTMLKLMRQRFGENPKIEYLLLDGKGLSGVPSASVDAAFSYSVFVHIQHWDIYNYLVELNRVLKPHGKAVIQHANTFSELGWPQFLADVHISTGRHKQWGTFTPMTPDMMREFVTRAGLRVERCVTDVVRRDAITLIVKPG